MEAFTSGRSLIYLTCLLNEPVSTQLTLAYVELILRGSDVPLTKSNFAAYCIAEILYFYALYTCAEHFTLGPEKKPRI